MIIRKNEILLLKSPGDSEDKFKPLLRKNGFLVQYLQVLDFVFINIPILTQKLKNEADYSGLIFTSPRAVTATKMSVNDQTVYEKWQNKKNFVVGETTFSLAEKELNLVCDGKYSGNANNLADIIIEGRYFKPFLFPCGNLKKETLQIRLKEHNIELDPVTVYETIKSQHLSEEFCDLTSNFTSINEYILFFSPSGVKYTNEIIRKLPLNEVKLIAIGPSTEKALNEANLPVYAVALKPTDSEVLNAILNTKGGV